METFFDVLWTIFIVCAFMGGILLLVVPIVGAFAVFDGWRGRALRRVPTGSVDAMRAGEALPRRVVVRATSVGDPTVAPVSGEECLWFRVILSRVDEVTTDSGHDLRYETVWSETSGGSVWFDDGTGAVAVDVSLLEKPVADGRFRVVERSAYAELPRDPADADVPGSPGLRSVVRRAMKPTHETKEFSLTEDVIRAGTTVTLFARPTHRGGELTLTGGPGTRVGVSDLAPAEVANSSADQSREGWFLLRLLLILGAGAFLCGAGGATLTDLVR